MTALKRRIQVFVESGFESFSRLQPADPKPNVSGAQVSQQRPITLGLHSQSPPSSLQKGPSEPATLHLQADKRYKDEMEMGENTQKDQNKIRNKR